MGNISNQDKKRLEVKKSRQSARLLIAQELSHNGNGNSYDEDEEFGCSFQADCENPLGCKDGEGKCYARLARERWLAEINAQYGQPITKFPYPFHA